MLRMAPGERKVVDHDIAAERLDAAPQIIERDIVAGEGLPPPERAVGIARLPAQPGKGAPIGPVDCLHLEAIIEEEDGPGGQRGMAAHTASPSSILP